MTTTFTPIVPDHWAKFVDMSEYPLLELALRDRRPAYSVRVEWLVDRLEGGVVKHRGLSNYTQILRQPFWAGGQGPRRSEATKTALERILRDAETILWHGKPTMDYSRDFPLSTCGGVLHYLRRRMYENDTVTLRELRPLTLIEREGERSEWVWEFSLQVNPGRYQRGMSPICLPSTPKPTPAWVQGAALDKEPIPA